MSSDRCRPRSTVFGEGDLFLLLVQHLDRQPEALQLLDQHLERLGHAWLEDVLALDDRLVRLDAADHVVRLDGQDLLQRVRRAVRLERPHLHLAEALAAELRLATQRLLGDQRVRARRPGVDLVLDQVDQLQHVDVADRDFLVERLAGAAVAQADLARLGQPGPLQLLADVGLGRAVEDRRGELDADLVGGPAQVRLQDLADVHAARHAQRIQDDVDRPAVGQERHVLLRQDARDHALVAVAAGHLVARGDLALLGDRDAHHLVDARRQLGVRVALEDLDVDHLAALAVRHAQAGVLHLARLFTEDRPQQALLGGQLGLALRRDLADQDVARLDLGADADDPVLVEVAQRCPRRRSGCRG